MLRPCMPASSRAWRHSLEDIALVVAGLIVETAGASITLTIEAAATHWIRHLI